MLSIDFRTIFFSYVVINVVSLLLIISLYFQIKKRFAGTFFILLSFFLIATGNIMVFLRSYIPDWISIIASNTLIISSTVLLKIGLEKFADKKGPQIQNYILVVVFCVVHSYFTFVEPNLNARSINFSFASAILSFQVAFLMLKRVSVTMQKITRQIGIIFYVVVIFQISHIFFILKRNSKLSNYFSSEPSETFYVIAWEVVLIFLAYSIFLMYNKRLIIDLNIQEEKFSKAFHAAPFIIMLSKIEDGEVFEVNKKVEEISGYHPKELINHKTTDLHLWEHNNDRKKFISDLKAQTNIVDTEYTFRKKSGELFTGLISANTIEINNEHCIISVISDISDRKIAENKLIASEASLRELNSTKDKFFSIIAHDLKSPFNGILGFSDLLIERIHNKDYNGIGKYAKIIQKSSQRAFDLLTNLMDWSRLQTDRMEYNPEYIEVNVLLKSVKDLSNISAKKKSIDIELNLPDKLLIYADKSMIETVLRNLISNAIKFTPKKGKIVVSAQVNEKDILFLINDNGVGIDKNNLTKLFRIDKDFSLPGTENETGTGLGLILCKDFIEKHNGKIWVESELNVGSTFYFSIPIL